MKAKAVRGAGLCGDSVESGAAEAGPGTTRKLAVDRPAPAGTQKRLRMDAGLATVEAETVEELRTAWAERDAIEDRLWKVEAELGEMQQFMGGYPGSHAAWLARNERKQKKKSSSRVAG